LAESSIRNSTEDCPISLTVDRMVQFGSAEVAELLNLKAGTLWAL